MNEPDRTAWAPRDRDVRTPDRLPAWGSVLAVCAHPDDESFGLGAVLSTFIDAGSRVSVLCLTQGEASTLGGAPAGLAAVRAQELESAANVLGALGWRLLGYPDGALTGISLDELAAEVVGFAREVRADGMVVFDKNGVTGHLDHVRATVAAERGAASLELPVLAWTLPAQLAAQLNEEYGAAFSGRAPELIDLVVPVDRARQRLAVQEHPSQAVPGSVLWRRLELLGGVEHLRWLRTADR